MAVDIPLDLDSGPIVWVKAELDATLLAALDGITRIQAGDSTGSVASVRANVHRAAGAFELVGVEGLAVLLREFEMHLPDPPEAPAPEALQTIASACRRLIAHLEEIAVGGQPVPLRFLPEYLTLGRLRKVRFGPADLFFPDLSRKPRFMAEAEPVETAKLPAYLLRHRRDFQRGFLDWLRGGTAASGLAIMERALAGIEAAHPLPAQRAFWWSTSALLEAAQVDEIGASTSIKQLFARVDLQIRRLVEGSTKVADRLKREVLYHVARVSTSSPRCDEVKALYGLEVLVPKRVPRELDIVALRPAIDHLNELVNRCKEEWGAVSTQRAGAAERLVTALAELPRACDAIGLRSLSELGSGLANVAPLIATRSLTDEASLEFASCLLLLETSTQHLAALPRNFAAEVSTALKRLGYASSRAPIPAELVDDIGSGSLTRLAQERETIAQVCREIRTNMRQVEAALDAVFRDPAAVEDLGAVPGLLAQVSGALRLLGWNDANTIIAAASDRVATLVADPSGVQPEEIDRVANVLAGFGFYIDARERKEAGAEAILESLVRSLRGEAASVVSSQTEHSVELALGSRIRALKSEFANFQGNVNDTQARAALVTGLNDVRRDAELLDDAPLVRAAKASLDLLAAPAIDLAALRAELVPVLGVSAAPQPVSAETQRILEASPDSQDDALLEIFVEEADEVVGNIKRAMVEYSSAPSRRDLLVDIRRGFHTLKGSGRMVGLSALGDAAWSVERVLNPVLEESRSLSSHESELIEVAATQFERWVRELQTSGRADVPADPFAAWVAKCNIAPLPSATPAAQSTPRASVEQRIAASQDSVALPTAAAASAAAAAAAAGAAALSFSLDESKPSLAAAPAARSVEDATSLPTLEFVTTPLAVAPPAPAAPDFEGMLSPSAPASDPVAIPFEEILFEPLPVPPSPAVSAPAAAATVSAVPSLPTWSDEIELDGVRVSRTLFSIMGDEARSHLATLDQEFSLMQFDPGLLPSDSMVRASHTLCGIHRTAGFDAIGHLAGLLEDALISVRRSKRVEASLALLADSIETLRAAVLRLQTQTPMSDAEAGAIAEACERLESFIAASGGARGGAAAEMAARASIDEEQSFDIEEIEFDLPAEFDHAPPSVAPLEVILAPEAPPVLVEVRAPVVEPTLATPVAEALAPVADTPVATPSPSVEAEPLSLGGLGAFGAMGVGAVGVGAIGLGGSLGVAAASVEPSLTQPSQPIEPTQLADTLPQKTVVSDPSVTVSVPVDMRGASPLIAASTPSATTPTTEDPLLGINDDIDVQVLPIFLEEAHELFPVASSQLRAWRAAPLDRGNLDSLKRTLHTLKGSARMAGAMRLGELTHIVESAVEEKSGNWTEGELDRIEERFDDVAFVLDALIAGKHDVVLPRFAAPAEPAPSDVPESASAVVAGDAIAGALATAGLTAVEEAVAPASAAATFAAPAAQPVSVATTTTAATAISSAESAVAFLRVRTDAVESLADEAGEIAINRSRIESELRGIKSSFSDLTSFVARLRTLLREIEIQGESQIQSRLDQESTFDPLEFDRYTRFQELTRSLAEGVNDVATVQQNLVKNIDDAETALAAQTRLSRSVQLRLQSLRTVPFSTVSERLYRVLRQTAKDVNKRANLDIEGGRIEIDRGVLERLMPVLEHLVRNSLAHGIEMPEQRQQRGKAEIGEINIAVKQQGNEVAIVFSDDGSGIALERVRQRAIAVGLAVDGDALNDAQLIEFIFRPGFSTADSITAVAGRGVGMDVVRSELAALGGRVVAATTAGVGTTFTLSVPLTLAVTQVLLVDIAGTVYGLPSSLIDTVRQLPSRERMIALTAKQIEVAGKFLPYRSMSVLLGGRPNATQHKTYSVAFVRVGETAAAIEIDRVIGNQEVVAKPYGPQLARLPGMAGLTVLGDGRIVLLMDPLALLRASADASVRTATPTAAVASTPVAPVVASLPSVEAIVPTVSIEPMVKTPAPATSSVAPSEPIAAPASLPVAALAVGDEHTHAPVAAPSVAAAGAASTTAEPIVITEPVLFATPSPVATPTVVVAAPPAPPPEPEPEPEVLGRLPIVLVVDDSLTVRKITSRLLDREGYKSMTAKDGLDALQVLSTVNPDVILLDIEMPRMDGFEFARTIKSDNRQNNIPIIMITSRTAEKHRSHAQELGVNEYVGKPYQDDELLALIAKYTSHVVRPQ